MEQAMQGMFGRNDDASFEAQEFAYEAMEAMAQQDWERAHEMASRATKLDANCIDALHIISELGSNTKDELIDNLRQTVDRAERALGKKFFQKNVGYFWGLLETRPYMRARERLAGVLYSNGRVAEAIEHFEKMLRLNPGDNQGLRYTLLGCYLERDNLRKAEQLFGEYPDEGSAMFAWAKVLASFLGGDEAAANTALAEARQLNKHVEAYLTGRKKMPGQGPGYYSPGEPSEAIVCMSQIGAAWKKHPEAGEWLKRQQAKSRK